MGFFDLFRNKNKKTVPEEKLSDESLSLSMSLSMSKGTIQEEDSRPDDPEAGITKDRDSITNEEIVRGTKILDTYEVISDAVRGGMGSVWKVRHGGWNTDLAMKRPQPRFFSEGSEKRKENFVRECEAWINLGLHPNIVSCYYVREISGVPTIFSEWMENGSLKNRIEDGSLYEVSEEQKRTGGDRERIIQARLLDIAIQFARGLHYAHESRDHLIHQDVKPDNLLLTMTWEAKVADFGLARARTQLFTEQGENAAGRGGTQPAGTFGADSGATLIAATGGYTPAYCSSEQYLGEPLTRRTDIYSWALSVLEMYLGTRPWKNGAEAGRNCGRYFDKSRVAMPESLRALLTGCLAERPEDRPHDFGIIEAELEKIYQSVSGHPYLRSDPRTAADTAASLNNKALSYIDLGRDEEADELLKQAVSRDGSVFLYHYNYALHRWNRRLISDAAFMTYLRGNADESGLHTEVMDKLAGMRGNWDLGKKVYSYRKDERPGNLEELMPLSDTSSDGTYQVKGYMTKERFQPEKYGYRIEDLRTGEIREYANDYGDYGESTPRGGSYMHPHYYKSDDVKFAGTDSELVVMQADVLWFFDAKSGRLLLSMPPLPDEDGDTMPYEVLGYTESGIIEYMNWEQRWGRWTVDAIRLRPETELPYELAGIATVDARLKAEEDMIRYYEEARQCWEKGDVAGTHNALSRSLSDQVLTMHEPSMQLWSELGAYYKKGSLITVVPTSDEPTPVPQRRECLARQEFAMTQEYKNRTDNGRTELILEYDQEDEFDSCNDMFEYTFYYRLSAFDKASGKRYFDVNNLEIACEADWKRFSKDRYLGLTGDHLLWYAQEYADPETIDLAEISRDSMKFKNGVSRVSFSLPNGYVLRNTDKGVDIGGFVFEDVFTDFRPLWNSEVIACRDHNYRLVYEYVV